MERLGFIHEKLDIKILILYILRRLPGTVEPETLAELCQCDSGIGYFDYSDCLAELVETGHLVLEDDRYAITEKGRRDGAACESSLPYSVKRKAGLQVSKLNGALRRNAQVRSQVLERAEGGFTVELALDDDGGNLFSLSLFCASRDQGERLCSGFQAKPERVYNEVLSALLDEEETE